MKKYILSLVFVLVTTMMSFKSINFKENSSKKIVTDSPECFGFADQQTKKLSHLPIDYENLYNIWSYYYDMCESISNFDEFQFPN